MYPTASQIHRARLVALWRRRFVRAHGLHWHDHNPHEHMRLMGLAWPEIATGRRIREALRPNSHERPNRTISNSQRPRRTPPDLELPNDFPY